MSVSDRVASALGRLAQRALVPVGLLVAAMWVLEIIDVPLDGRLDRLGIEPRDADGLTGVVAAPFLHSGFGHLIANTTGLVVLGVLLALSTRSFWLVVPLVTVLGGLAVWALAPSNTVHVGASGLVYGLAAYLVARGVFQRRAVTIVIAVVVLLLYGGLVLGVLPGQPGISWQSHLFGAAAGVLVAWAQARDRCPTLADHGVDESRRYVSALSLVDPRGAGRHAVAFVAADGEGVEVERQRHDRTATSPHCPGCADDRCDATRRPCNRTGRPSGIRGVAAIRVRGADEEVAAEQCQRVAEAAIRPAARLEKGLLKRPRRSQTPDARKTSPGSGWRSSCRTGSAVGRLSARRAWRPVRPRAGRTRRR
jgi:membrane associated rhomboid family serine protease